MTSAAAISQYTGRYPKIDDPLTRTAFKRGVLVSEYYYPAGTADYDQKCRQVLLNEETVDFIYSSYTSLELHYVPGSRPVLERIVNKITRPNMSEREKVLAITRYCHEGFKKDFISPLPDKTMIFNASEEEVLKFGGGQCEDRTRVIICLCQIAGLPARQVAVYGHWEPENGYSLSGGHSILEVYVEGGWAFFDSSLMDFYCLKPDGKFASLWDIWRNPKLVENQPESVYKDCNTTKEKFIWYRDMYLNTRGTACIANYNVWDGWRYDWNWVRYSYDQKDPVNIEGRKFRSELRLKLLEEAGVPKDKIK